MKLIAALLCPLLLVGCQTSTQAMLQPKGTYIEGLSGTAQPVTFVTTKRDKSGNYFPTFISVNSGMFSGWHTSLEVYPPPKTVQVRCEMQDGNVRKSGYRLLSGPFAEGRQYEVSCVYGVNNTYAVTHTEVTSKQATAATPTSAKPTVPNKVTFVNDDGLDPNRFWIMQGTLATGIQNWNGDYVAKAERATPSATVPLAEVNVFCRSSGVRFPIKGPFYAGKTYQVKCVKPRSSDVEVTEIPS